MRKVYHLTFLLLFPSLIFAAPQNSMRIPADKEPTGFQDIPFGLTKDEVEDKLVKNLHLTRGSTGEYNDYTGPNGLTLKNLDGFIEISNFLLGDKSFSLFFTFNKNGKFYEYDFHGEQKSANYFDTSIQEDAQYLSKVFESKFGRPQQKFNPKFYEVKQGYVTYFWKWKSKRHSIYTGLSTYDSNYNATATVSDDVLSRENDETKEKMENESAKKAAKTF